MTTRMIDIRPTSSVYATYRRLSYKPWNAVAEFVDNSTQSFFDHERELAGAEGEPAVLEVRIFHDKESKSLTITDNAFGMDFESFERAIQLNKPPVGKKTRNEFGMGLKTAASWMGGRWRVRSKALGASEEYAAELDIDKLVADEPEGIQVSVRSGRPAHDHYTVIEIEQMYRVFQTRTTSTIKNLLGSMYRRDLASGRIKIYWNDDPLIWEEDPIFREQMQDGSEIEWRTPLEFEVEGHKVTGWAAIRIPGSGPRAGFALFRKGRIIVGGPNQGWKPDEIFAHQTSFERQRLFGELDVDSFPVTQAKDGFDWDGGLEDELSSTLRPKLQGLIDRARGVSLDDESGQSLKSNDVKLAIDTVATEFRAQEVGDAVEFFESAPPVSSLSPEDEELLVSAAEAAGIHPTETLVGEHGGVVVKWWLLEDEHQAEDCVRVMGPREDELHVMVNLNHPFMVMHVGTDPGKLNLFLKTTLANALAENAAGKRPEEVRISTLRKFRDSFLRSLPTDRIR